MPGNRSELSRIRRWLRSPPRRISSKTGPHSLAVKAKEEGAPGNHPRTARSRRPPRVGVRMSDLIEMSRVLYDHQWESTDDWVRKLDQLADLTDEEIGRLVHLSVARLRPAGR